MGFRLVTLNMNGIRSAHNKGFLAWAESIQADCMGVQEVKAQHDSLRPGCQRCIYAQLLMLREQPLA